MWTYSGLFSSSANVMRRSRASRKPGCSTSRNTVRSPWTISGFPRLPSIGSLLLAGSRVRRRAVFLAWIRSARVMTPGRRLLCSSSVLPILLANDPFDADELVALLEIDEPDALCGPTDRSQIGRGHPHDDPVLGNEDHVILVRDCLHPDHEPITVRRLDVDSAASISLLKAIFRHGGSLFAAREERHAFHLWIDDDHVHDFISVVERNAPDAAGGSPHGARIALGESDSHSTLGPQNHLVPLFRKRRPKQNIAFLENNGDDPGPLGPGIGAQDRLLYRAPPRRHKDAAHLIELSNAKVLAHRLAALELNEVDERPSFRGARHVGDVIDLAPVHFSPIREEEDVVVSRGGEQILDVVAFLCVRPNYAAASPSLTLVRAESGALDVTLMADRDNDLFLGDEVLDVDVLRSFDDLGSSFIAVGLLNLGQILQ